LGRATTALDSASATRAAQYLTTLVRPLTAYDRLGSAWPRITSLPVSSATSRTAHAGSVSPLTSLPLGHDQSPYLGRCTARTRRSPPRSRPTRAPAARTVPGGYRFTSLEPCCGPDAWAGVRCTSPAGRAGGGRPCPSRGGSTGRRERAP